MYGYFSCAQCQEIHEQIIEKYEVFQKVSYTILCFVQSYIFPVVCLYTAFRVSISQTRVAHYIYIGLLV